MAATPFRVTIAVMGDVGVGKSSLVNLFANSPVRHFPTEIEQIDFSTTVDDQPCELGIIDIVEYVSEPRLGCLSVITKNSLSFTVSLAFAGREEMKGHNTPGHLWSINLADCVVLVRVGVSCVFFALRPLSRARIRSRIAKALCRRFTTKF